MRARRATADDVEEICRICAEGWRDTYRGLRDEAEIERVIATFYVPERVRGELAEDGQGWGGWWVAESDGRLLAAGGGGLSGPGTGELYVLYADPARRGEGAGTAVLEAVTAQQVARGAREQWVSVEPGNAGAIAFYEARGFVRRGTREAFGMCGRSARYRRPLAARSGG